MPSLHLITAEDPLTLQARSRELIRFPQLTMPLLAGLTPPDWIVSHEDEIVTPVDTTRRYDLVGITAATPGAPHAYDLAREFRNHNVPVAMGGPHATLMPYEVAQHADIVVVGEAEPLWRHILRDEERRPPGMHAFHSGTVEVTPQNSRIYRHAAPASLEGLPRARRELIQHGGWNRWWATKGAIIATRGCPHKCDYCTIPHLYPRAQQMRLRPVPEVIAEIRSFRDKGVVFWDDNLAAVPAYAKELCRQLKPLKRWWTSQTTMNSLRDQEFLQLAAASGCKALFVGLESIDQQSLNQAQKGHNRVQDYRQLLNRCHDLGIAIQAGIIFGFENDDLDIFKRTVDIFGDIGLDNATISLLVPYPGTPAYTMLEQQGRIIDKNWRHYNGKTHVVFRPRHMSPDQLLNGYEWAKTQFYSISHIARRLAKSRTGLWWNIPRNLGYHLGLRGEVLARAALHQA
ncbi:B12-binding domain-containing radical SAM protein [bacterium]|nr:B12-binding domain-containing radical SAM protein [bacterium]